MEEVKQEADRVINQTTSIIQSIRSNNTAAQIAHLGAMIPQLDSALMSYKPFFESSLPIYGDEQLMSVINQRLRIFLRNKKTNILSMYEKTFQHYDQMLDSLTKRIVTTSTSFKMIIENSDAEIISKIEDKNRKFESDFKETSSNNKQSLESIAKDVDANINSLNSRLDEENKRLTQHFEKLLQSKTESLVMTEAAYERAKKDVDQSTNQAKSEISSLIQQNNDVLKKHNETVMVTIVEEEKKVNDLQEQVDKIMAKQKEIAPEIDKRWKEREAELKKRFENSDEEYERQKMQTISQLHSSEKQLNEYLNILKEIKDTNDSTFQSLIDELERRLKEIIERRPTEISLSASDRKEKHKAKIARLKESIELMNQQAKNDEKTLKSRIRDKALSHVDRLKKLEDSQVTFVSDIAKETSEIKSEIEDTKVQWENERKSIENGYKQDLVEVKQKTEKEQKYYDTKYEALRKELHRVLQENSKILNQAPDDKNELTLLDLKHHDDEAQLSSRLAAQLQAKVNERIKSKMSELKAKHNAEREKLIEEINSARTNENNLQSKLSECVEKANEEPSNQIVSGFTSARFVEAQTEKWREDFFVDCKLLKEEEASALKKLDHCKVEFKEAVQRTIDLREKLAETSAFYMNSIEESKGKNEEELKEFKAILVAKEKEITELERQYEENERELHRRTRQIEQAEDKLANLRSQLANEKTKIKEKIKQDYQPLIKQEQRKAEVMVNEIEKLRNELELTIEYTQHDLFVVEASNTAMGEGLQKETDELVRRMREHISEELREKEDKHSYKVADEESNCLNRVNELTAKFEEEERTTTNEYEKRLQEQQTHHKNEITKLNDICMTIIQQNSEKKKKIISLGEIKCSVCPALQKNIKKLEKTMIGMQVEARDLALTDQNKNDMYKTFHKNTRKNLLPPMVKY